MAWSPRADRRGDYYRGLLLGAGRLLPAVKFLFRVKNCGGGLPVVVPLIAFPAVLRNRQARAEKNLPQPLPRNLLKL